RPADPAGGPANGKGRPTGGEMNPGRPPRANEIASRRLHHGDLVVDEYAGLQDREDPDTSAYLRAESDHTAAATAHLGDLADSLLGEFRSRTREADLTVPVR